MCVCRHVASRELTADARQSSHCWETTNCMLPTPATPAVFCVETARPSTCPTTTNPKILRSRTVSWKPEDVSPVTAELTVDWTCLVRSVTAFSLPSLCLHFNRHFVCKTVLDGYNGANDDGNGVMTTAVVRHAKLQLSHCHQQTNTHLLTGRISFLSSNQHHKSTEWNLVTALHL